MVSANQVLLSFAGCDALDIRRGVPALGLTGSPSTLIRPRNLEKRSPSRLRRQRQSVRDTAEVFEAVEGRFDGLITNDKFCLVRTAQLVLTWWRRPLRGRGCVQANEGSVPDLESDRGEAHASPLAGPSADAGCSGRGTALGPSVRAHPGVGTTRGQNRVGGNGHHLPSDTGGEP
jgi:hypothetical protein